MALGQWLDLLDFTGISVWMLGRLFNTVWTVLAVIILARCLAILNPNRWLAAALLAAALATTYMNLPFRLVRNDTMAIALALAGAYALILAAKSGGGRARTVLFAVAGACVAASAGTKQSFAFVAFALAAYPFLEPNLTLRQRVLGVGAPLAFGGFLASLPMLYWAVRDFDNFQYSVFEFHRSAHALYSFGTTDIGLGYRLQRVRELMSDDAMQVLLALGAMAVVVVPNPIARARVAWSSELRGFFLFCVIVTVAMTASLLLVIPIWSQYLAGVPPFLAMGIAALAGAMAPSNLPEIRTLARHAVLGALGIVAVLALKAPENSHPFGLALHMANHTVDPSKPSINAPEGEDIWLSTHLERVRERMHSVLGPPSPSLTVATVMSGYPLDAGFSILPEMASAPFFYRTNDRFSADTLDRRVGASPSRMSGLLAERSVPAVLVGFKPVHEAMPADIVKDRLAGFERLMEAGMYEYAEAAGFACYTVDMTGGYNMSAARLLVAPEFAKLPPDC